MSKILKLDAAGNPEQFDFILCHKNMDHIGMLSNVQPGSVVVKGNMNAADELSFTVYKTLDEHTEPLWDSIIDFKLIYVPNLYEYFEITVSMDEDRQKNTYKQITATSLCEAELGQIMLYDIEINTEDDIARDDYVVTKFYSQKEKKGSLLDRILEKAPHYSIGHVDSELMDIQRSFSIDGTSIYDFLTGDCAEQFNCIFIFDSTTRTINAYDLYTLCNNCGHRGAFNDVCPKCGSTNLKVYGEDTTIYVDKENLTDSVQFETNTDDVKNTFHLVAGDDDMTAAVRNINPNGSAYIHYFCNDTLNDMSEELREKIKNYSSLYQSKQQDYASLTQKIYDTMDGLIYLQSGMLPTFSTTISTAQNEVTKIQTNLTEVAVRNVSSSTGVATVDGAIRSIAPVYIKSGYFRAEIPKNTAGLSTSAFTYKGKDGNGNPYGTWTGQIKITNISDKDDVATTGTMSVKVTAVSQEYLNQKIKKTMAKVGKEMDKKNVDYIDAVSVLDNDAETLKTTLKQYCMAVLVSYRDAVQAALDVMQAEGHGTSSSDYYQDMYVPYYEKIQVIEAEIDARQADIDAKSAELDGYMAERQKTQDELNFRQYLGQDLFKEYCSFRRQDEYSNDNYISDDLNNAEIIANAWDFLDAAREQINIAGEPQHSLSSTLYNLLLMPEFKPLVDKFQLGNWIRVGIDDKVYRLRLTSYQISFSDLTTIDVEFSDLTRTANGYNDVNSILSSAHQMATSYDYVAKQSEMGKKAEETFSDMRKNSLNATLYRINNNDAEEVSYDRFGILSRSYDDVEQTYDKEQLKITHNVIAFTDDYWKSVKCALGKQTYKLNGTVYEQYGLNADFVLAGQIIGGDIYSDNFSDAGETPTGTHINLKNGDFSFAGGKLTYSNALNELNLQGKISSSQIESPTIYGGVIKSQNYDETTNTGSYIDLNGSGFSFGDGRVYYNSSNGVFRISSEAYLGSGNYKLSQLKTDVESAASTASSALSAAGDPISYITKSELFNKLTDNGATQGIYMSGNRLYINADYIQSGDITADYIHLGGQMSVYQTGSGNALGGYIGYMQGNDGMPTDGIAIGRNSQRYMIFTDASNNEGIRINNAGTSYLFGRTRARFGKDLWVDGNLQVDGTGTVGGYSIITTGTISSYLPSVPANIVTNNAGHTISIQWNGTNIVFWVDGQNVKSL